MIADRKSYTFSDFSLKITNLSLRSKVGLVEKRKIRHLLVYSLWSIKLVIYRFPNKQIIFWWYCPCKVLQPPQAM